MELKLIVLAGAKEGLEIRLKKDKFLIGRAKECALRAASEAISRRHCAIVRAGDGWTVRDLGSRNGTYVNDTKITAEVPLNADDELRVGPLKFRVAVATPKVNPALPPLAPVTNHTPKKPPVKDVAEVVERTISLSDSATEDDISRWLLGEMDNTLKETRSLRAEDTNTALNRATVIGDKQTVEDVSEVAEEMKAAEDAAAGEAADDSKGGWNLFRKGGKGSAKKKPGKLPPRPQEASKDSREAAADILREMTRRR
jgi:pSer/pThr/pTyr-binding forkhead associated (FHA) protein